MKAVVTGGAGFIGSHLCEHLIANGHEVRAIDNLCNGRMDNLSQVIDHPRFQFSRLDIVNQVAIEPLFDNVDWVFHLAGMADIVPSICNPKIYHDANVTGTLSVLQAAKNCSVKRFIYAASSSSYGIPDTYPTPETARIKPEYPYALTKWLGECYVLHWANVYKLPALSLRLFNVYGPRVRTNGTYGAAFGVFLAQKAAGKPFTVVGDGTQTRDFTFVTDVTNAFVTAAESSITQDVFNVGSDRTTSVNEIVSHLGGPITHIPKRPGEPDCTFADISKIKHLLNWSPKISIEVGIHEMLKHLDMWKEAPVWEPETIQEATKEWFELLKTS